MIKLIKNEWIKIFARKSSYVYLILLVVFLFIGAFAYDKLFHVIGGAMTEVAADGSSTATEEQPSVWNFLNTVVLGITSFVTLFSVIVVSQNISAEFGDGTIKQLLIRPYKRWKILLSKYFAVNLYSLLLLIGLVAFGFIIGSIFFGTGGFHKEIVTGGLFSDAVKTTTEGGQFIQTFIYYLPGLILINTISFMLSTLFKNQALAVGVGIFVLFISSTLSGIFTMLLDRYEWFKYLIFPNLDLTIYTYDDTVNGMTVGFSFTVMVVYYLLFMIITFYSFQKRDIVA
ncbi:ABC transporter permease [Caldibacillus lycopersici]|uniref:ABC transporter permease n=1 Tax=Perspicuibacillus lycopersici TaxID=1325689 RepID=A0AAE3IUY3_9BACI|nr:ABC transporter permease [Perspicuibacillus lycopersici]MCU9613866.1 ABC transporter permease [Perspicuibacillus lycopersici]